MREAMDFNNIREEVNRELVARLCAALGYTFDEERTRRIAKEAQKMIDQGNSASAAFPEALEVDLILYGDPQER